MDQVDHRAHVGRVRRRAAGRGHGRAGNRSDQIGGVAGGQHGGERLAVAVIQQELCAGLPQAAHLLVRGLLEAVVVGFQVQRGGQLVRVVEQLCR